MSFDAIKIGLASPEKIRAIWADLHRWLFYVALSIHP